MGKQKKPLKLKPKKKPPAFDTRQKAKDLMPVAMLGIEKILRGGKGFALIRAAELNAKLAGSELTEETNITADVQFVEIVKEDGKVIALPERAEDRITAASGA